MRARSRMVAAVLLLGLAATAAVGACSDNTKPPPLQSDGVGGGVGGGSPPVKGAPSSPAPSASAPSPEAGGDPCSGLTLGSGQPLVELELMGQAPAARGGALSPGTYDLSELYTYGSFDGGDPHNTVRPSGRSGQGSIIVTGDTLRMITAIGTDPQVGTPVVRAVSYRVDGTSLVATEKCPAAGTAVTMQFSATGVDGFALYIDPQHRMVYARR